MSKYYEDEYLAHCEKEGRQRNCKYCHEPFKMFGNEDAGFQINKHDQTISYYDYPAYCYIDEDEQFNYCPNCGRKLLRSK